MHGSNLKSLYQHVPQIYLPLEYGGQNGSIPDIIQQGVAKFLEYENYFQEDAEYGSNEKLRVGKLHNYDDIFGNEGSFRRLNVD